MARHLCKELCWQKRLQLLGITMPLRMVCMLSIPVQSETSHTSSSCVGSRSLLTQLFLTAAGEASLLWAQCLGLASFNCKLSLAGEADQAWKQALVARKSLPEGKDRKLEPSWIKGFRELPCPARYTVMCPRGEAMLEAGRSRSF